ncbi:MAG: glycosyltransferase [Caldimonas sp.]
MAGFEGADHINLHGEPLDMVAITGHAEHHDADFRRLASLGLRGIRESIGWRLAEPEGGGRFDFTRTLRLADAARRHGLQVAWTFMHYGVPHDVSLLDDGFIARFVDFAAAAARALRPFAETPPVYTPINEISYLAWACCESNFIHPHVGVRDDPRYTGMPDGFEVKRRLVRATLAAMVAIRSEDPRARFMHIDPLVHVVPPAGATAELVAEAWRFREFQWQAWDMLAGRLEPGLGGHPEALDLVGVNHYDSAQWEFASGTPLDWQAGEPRRLPFSSLLGETWARYRRPIVVAETGHVGPGRGRWLDEIAAEVAIARGRGIPVDAVCIYPIVDRPDWNDTSDWHRSGLWDAASSPTTLACEPLFPAFPGRHLDLPYAASVRRAVRGAQPEIGHLRSLFPNHVTTMKPTLLVLSHLRWNFVFQRPQHLLSRLAAHYAVVFVEEPVRDEQGPARLDASEPVPGVTVLRPRTSLPSHGFQNDQLALLGPLLGDWMREATDGDYIVWFYTPMALPLLDGLKPAAVVYDCMDELSAFVGAPPELREREAGLLHVADLVLTGGPSLYEAKRAAHPRVLCLPSSVDAHHFAPGPHAADDAFVLQARELQSAIAEPRLGYFGVIDERMDLALIERLADADPRWNIVMVGPVVKIDPASLPHRPNLHWLGQQSYELLPRLIETWEVGLLPFALNESTRFISPTKTLEYMAAGKPAISTAIRDVQTLYGDVVRIADSHDEFITACLDALAESAAQRRERALAMIAAVSRSSWDATAQTVHVAIEAVLDEHRAGRAALQVVELAGAQDANGRRVRGASPSAAAGA